jgi:gliding motility-associated-like protein
MNKIFTSLIIGFLVGVIQLSAQTPTFSIDPSSQTTQLTNVVEVDVTVSDFDNILSMQYAVKWDPTIFEFAELFFVNDAEFPTLSTGISTPVEPNVPEGQVNISWFNPGFTGVDKPDGTVVLTLRLTATGCGTSDIIFDDGPTPIEVLSGSFVNVGLNANNGTATVSGAGCGGNQTPEVDFTIANANVQEGNVFCLDVSVADFTNIADVALTIGYNPAMLSLNSVSNLNLTGLAQSDFDTNTSGEITLDWSNATGVTVSDGTVIFELCFEALQSGNTTVAFTNSPVTISVQDGSGMDVDFNGTDGNVTITPVPTGGDLTLNIPNINGNVGDQNVCITVTADNYIDVVGMAFTLSYNPGHLEFVEVTNLSPSIPGFSVPANFGTPPAIADGFITVNYFNNSLAGIDLPNGAPLFDICFNLIGSGNSSIEMTSDITSIEFSDSNQDVISSTDNPGSVSIQGGPISTDLTLTAESANVNTGDNFCIEVTADNFTDIVGMAFTMEYNPSQLQFVEVTNLNPSIPGFSIPANFGTPPPLAAGFITVNYFNNALTGINLPNGSVLFELCFQAISSGSSTIEFTSGITQIEFSDSNQDVVPPVFQDGSVTITGGPISTDLTLTAESVTVDPGDNFCIEVTADNFTDIVGMAFTMEYDPNQLQFVEVTNLNPGIPGFSVPANFGTPPPLADGFITVNYFNNSLAGINLPNGSVLFELCFEAIGNGSQSDIEFTSGITQIEFSDSNQDVVPPVFEDGEVNITGVFTDLRLTVEDVTVVSNESFCVEVTTENFEDIVGMAFTMEYDPAHLSFSEVTNLNPNLPGFSLAANFGTPPALNPGFITVNYFNNSLDGINLPDDAVLFELCFVAIGMDGTCSDIDFSSAITQIEFSDSNQDVVPFFSEEGTICVNDATPGVVQVEIDDANVDQGTNFCVPVTASNFIDVASINFTLTYDESVAELTGVSNITGSIPGLTISNFDTSTPGVVTVQWSGSGVTLPSNTTLFELCFNAIGDPLTSTALDINSSVVPINFEDSNQMTLMLDATDGMVNINPLTMDFLLTVGNDMVEPGETFCIPVTALNFEDVVGFAFTLNYNATQLMFNSIQNLNPNFPGFNIDANFGLPPNVAPGFITVNFFNSDLSGIDLANGEALFELCFTAIGVDGQTSDICFSSDITPIEISDSNQDVIPFMGECGTIEISDVQPPQILSADVTNVACNGGNDGSISVTVGGEAPGPFTYSWAKNNVPIPSATGSTIEDLDFGSYMLTVTDQSSGLTVTSTYTVFAPANPIVIQGGTTSPSCSGGSNGTIFTNVSGGTPGYTYNWTNGLPTTSSQSDLGAGSYTVTVTDNNGCTETRTFTVTDGATTTINIDANVGAATCNGDNDGSISLVVSGFIGGVTYVWADLPPPSGPSRINLLAGDYTVQVTDQAGCQNTMTVTVPEPDPITLTPTVTDVACFGETTGIISVSAEGGNGGFNYDWSNSQSGNTISALATGSYTVTASDSEGCFLAETYTVGGVNAPVTLEGFTTTPIDLGNDGEITLDIQGGNPPYDLTWTDPTGSITTTQALNLINLNEPGTYDFVATDENGCIITGSVELLRTLRIANFSIIDACFGEDNGSITLTMDGGVEPYTYSWNPNESTSPALINQGAGTVQVTVTDAMGESLNAEFDIGESPEITITSFDLIPVTGAPGNANGSVTVVAAGGTDPLSYLWSNGATSASIDNLTTGTYCVTITDSNFGNNCSIEMCYDVFYSEPLLDPVATPENTSCSYTEDGILTVEIPGGVSPFEVTIMPGSIVMSSSGSDNIFEEGNLAPGDYTIQVVDDLGQTASTNVTIGSPAPLSYTMVDYQNSLASTCDGNIEISISGGTPNYTVTWDNGGGTGPTPSGLCGDASYTPTIVDDNGCTLDTEPVFISAFDVTLDAIIDNDCPEDEFGEIEVIVSGGEPNFTYLWMDAQGQVIGNTEDIEELAVGTYTLTVIEGTGREITQTYEIGAMSSLAIDGAAATTDFNGFNVRCADSEDGVINAQVSGSSGYGFEWVRLSDNMMVGTAATLTGASGGDYELTVIDDFGCTMSTIVNVTAPSPLVLDGNVKDVSCAEKTDGAVQVFASGGITNAFYTYNWDNGVFGNQQINVEAGIYRVTASDVNNCTVEQIFTINVPDPIQITFDMEPATDGCNGTLTAEVTGGTEPYTYNWINAENASGATALDLCPTINNSSEYLLQVTDANRCLSELVATEVDDKRFPCLDERVVITPDGNGTNDEFIIFCVNEFPENHLEIYNRWGVLVFQAENYDNTWSGTDISGNPMPAGPYFYVLEYVDPEGNTLQQKGSLTILKDN